MSVSNRPSLAPGQDLSGRAPQPGVESRSSPPPEPSSGEVPAHAVASGLPTTESAEAPPAPASSREAPSDLDAVLGGPSGLVDGVSATTLIVWVLGAISTMMVIWNLQDASIMNANTGSRYATIHSLVDHGTYIIDKSPYVRTPDKIKPNGHFTSSKPPLLPTYGAGVYWLFQKLSGKNIVDHEGHVVWTVGLMTGVLFHVLLLIYFYRLCRLLLKRQLAIILSFAAAAFSWLGVAYATAINNHSAAASLFVIGFYYAYRARNNIRGGIKALIISGLCFGALPAIDLPSLALTGCAGLYILSGNWKRGLLFFVPAIVPGIAAQLLLGKIATGSYLPAYLNKAAKGFKGDYLSHRSGIDALREPKHIYAFNVFLGHHGLFSMTPLFGFGLYELVVRLAQTIRTTRDSAFKRLGEHGPERLFFFFALLITLTFYVFRTRSYGGWSVGMRWLVPCMPIFLIYFAKWLDRVRMRRSLWALVVASFLVSTFHVQDGLSSPFQFSVWHNWLENAPNRNRVGKKMNLGKAHKKKMMKRRRSKKKAKRAKRAKKSNKRPKPQKEQ